MPRGASGADESPQAPGDLCQGSSLIAQQNADYGLRRERRRCPFHDDDPLLCAPSRLVVMTEPSLRELYEDPGTPLSSGLERAQIQATMLAGIASSSPRPLVAVDVGCGDGMATALAAARCEQTPGADITIIGLDWSSAALEGARRRGVLVVRASYRQPGPASGFRQRGRGHHE